MSKKIWTWLVPLIVVIVILAIVIPLSLKPTPTTKEPIKIGIVLPLSGPVSFAGNQIKEGLELALEKYKDENIKLIYEDSKCKPADAVNAVQKLVNVDKVSLIVGDICSGATLAMIPITKENNLVIITPLSTNPNVTSPGNNAYRMVPSDIQEVSYMADYAYNKLNIKKIAILYENTDFGKGAEKIFREKYRGTIVASEAYNPDEVNYKTVLTKVKQNNPEGIYMISLPQQIGLILKQATELGIKATFLGKNAVEQPAVLEIAGKSSEGVIYTFFSKGSEEKIKEFKELFKQKYGKEPGTFEGIGYDLGQVVYLAVKDTKGDKEKIKQNMRKISFEGVTGKIEFDENGNIKEKPLFIKTIKNGQFVPYEE
jgi:branched-chain amino acid transport system substrate-binding protein